jgi:hypothetical protein
MATNTEPLKSQFAFILSQLYLSTVQLMIYLSIIKMLLMSFQAYLDNIKAKSGKGSEDFKKLADKKGFTKNGKLNDEVKAGEIVQWLKDDFELGHGHSMAIYALLKGITK